MLTSILTLTLALLGLPRADLASAVQRYRAGRTPMERVRALDEIASAQAPPEEVVVALSMGVDSGEAVVMQRAVELLHADSERFVVAIPDLVRACSSYEELQQELYRLTQASLSGSLADANKLMDRQKEVDSLRLALVQALVGVRDDRVVESLILLRSGFRAGDEVVHINETLIDIGTRSAIAGIMNEFSKYARILDERKKSQKSLKKQKPAPAPKGRDKKAWKASEKRRIARLWSEFEAVAIAEDAKVQALAESLSAWAKSRDLPAPPRRKDVSPKLWLSWWTRIEEDVAVSLEPSSVPSEG